MSIFGATARVGSGLPPYDYDMVRRETDELSLVDLWAVVYERRYWILGTTALAVLLGTASALTTPLNYSYTTTIEIGTRSSGESFVPLESTDTVVAKLEKSYIPMVLHELRNSTATDTAGNVKTVTPKGNGLVVLQSEGGFDDEPAYAALHEAVIQRLVADHDRILSVARNNLELTLTEASNRLAQLKDEARNIETQITRIAEEETLLLKEAKAMAQLVATTSENRDDAIREAKDEARAMTLLMLTEEIRRDRKHLMELVKRAKVELPNEKDTLGKLQADKERAQLEQEKAIDSIRLQLSNFQETRAIIPTLQSLAPVGTPRGTIIGTSAILGLVAGLMVAFIANFHRNFKNTTKRQWQAHPDTEVQSSPGITREPAVSRTG